MKKFFFTCLMSGLLLPAMVFSEMTLLQPESGFAKINAEKKMNVKINRNCDFGQVDLNFSSGKVICSPSVTDAQIDKGLTGLFINMPEKIPLNSVAEIKVCMLSIFNGKDAEKHGGSELLVLKSDVSNKVVNGRFIHDERLAESPDESIQAENDDVIEEEYFNFNLADFIRFDKIPGIYHFYITMGPFSSNVVSFEIVDNN